MRKIRLSDTDGNLFDEEMVPQDYEYLAKHKATFCRMWTDQGSKFWRRYVEVFRSYILRYSLLGDLTCDASQLQGTLEFAFVVITTQFIGGKVNQAKSLLNQIADLGKNRHRFIYLDSKSVIKDPFYTKETRDIFREFFGPANEKSSYIKVYLLTPVYMKFGGSIVRCLSKWMEAEEMAPDDDSYFIPPTPIEINTPVCTKHPRSTTSLSAANLCAFHLDDCKSKFYAQYVKGNPTTPEHLDFWEKEDPRFCHPGNPLWNPGANKDSDWRDNLTIEKFREFYTWCTFNDAIVKPEDQCQDCWARKKAKKRKKKKKKKAESSMPDYDLLEEFPLAIDSGASTAEVKSKVVAALTKVCDGTCQHNGRVFTPDVDDYETQPLRLVSQKTSATISCPEHSSVSWAACYETLMAGVTLEAEVLEKIHLDTKVTVLCNKEPDCGCALCTISRKFYNLEGCFDSLDSDSDSLSEAETSSNWREMKKGSKKRSAEQKLEKQAEKEEETGSSTGNIDVKAKLGQKELFGAKTVTKKRTEALKLPLRTEGFLRAVLKVQTKTDPELNTSETAVTLVDVSSARGRHCAETDNPSIFGKKMFQKLTPLHLTKMVKSLPITFSAEGRTWCLVEVDYSIAKKATGSDIPTHFVLKISNPADPCDRNISILKRLLIALLQYVVSRKKRPSPGWVLSDEDIFVFLQTLGADNFHVKGTTFTIVTGGSGIDVMTTTERMQHLYNIPAERKAPTHRGNTGGKDKVTKNGTVAATSGSSVTDQPSTNMTNQKKTTKGEKLAREVVETVGATSGAEVAAGADAGLARVSTEQAADNAHDLLKPEAAAEPGMAASSDAAATNSGDSREERTVEEQKKNMDIKKRVRRMSDIDSDTDPEVKEQMYQRYGDLSPKNVSDSSDNKPRWLSLDGQRVYINICSNCSELESTPSLFRMCGMCVDKKMAQIRYYCGPHCQRKHWGRQHCQEHRDETLTSISSWDQGESGLLSSGTA